MEAPWAEVQDLALLFQAFQPAAEYGDPMADECGGPMMMISMFARIYHELC